MLLLLTFCACDPLVVLQCSLASSPFPRCAPLTPHSSLDMVSETKALLEYVNFFVFFDQNATHKENEFRPLLGLGRFCKYCMPEIFVHGDSCFGF